MAYGLTQSPLLVAATPSYCNTGTSPLNLNITGNITIETWVKFASMPADRADIVSKPNTASNSYAAYSFELLKSGTNYDLRLVRSLSGTPTLIISKTSWNPTIGTWYHVAVTHSPSSGAAEIVIDGTSAATATQAGTVDGTTHSVYIGAFGLHTVTNLPFDGRISLVRIWDIIRTAAEINANKCVVYGTATTNMQAEWSLDNVLTDASGNGNTLTNVNSVTFAANTPSVCATTTKSDNLLLMGVS